MAWLKYILAAGLSTRVFQNNGVYYIGVSGNTYPVRQQLKSLGFSWDNGRAEWYGRRDAILRNPQTVSALQSIGIAVNAQPSPPQQNQQNQQNQNQFQQPQPTNWYNKSVRPVKFYLAKSKSDTNNPPMRYLIVGRRQDGGWDVVAEPGKYGEPSSWGINNDNDAQQMLESVRDESGNKISAPDVDTLLSTIAQLRQKEQQGVNPQTNEPKVPGRIPRERISEQQKAIENTFISSNKAIMMNALAGSGKTTMLRDLASFKKPEEKWLYLVFNKKNQIEASRGKGKFPNGVEVLTSHSFLGSVLNNSSQMNLIKSTDLWNQKGERLPRIIDETMENDNTFPRSVNFAAKKIIRQLASLSKAFAINPSDPQASQQMMNIIQQYQLDTTLSSDLRPSNTNYAPQIIDKALDALHYSLPGNAKNPDYQNLRDHDDTLWYAAIDPKVNWPHYDVVLADEVQDFNRCQMIMLQKLAEAGARIVAVGDPNQCQPAGTMVAVTGGPPRPIETLQIGDEVVTYDSKKSYFPGVLYQGRKITKTAVRPYSGEMIEISTETTSHKCTPNHKCLVKFPLDDDLFCTYLVIKGSQARVGMSRLRYQNGLGLAIRAKQEGADAAYLLGIYKSAEDARISEIVISARFGLPQMIFHNNGQVSPTKETISQVYGELGDNIRRAIKCLKSFGRRIEFPLWSRREHNIYQDRSHNYIGSSKTFVTQACNLVDGMLVRTFDGTNRGGSWEKIAIKRETVNCNVYSLEVEPDRSGRRLYIANGIVTHNSIYMFRGADAHAFENVHNLIAGNTGVSHELPVNYRSGRKIIEYVNQNTKVNNLQAGMNFDGMVTEGTPYDGIMASLVEEWEKGGGSVTQSTAIISRTNRPLVSAAIDLMKNNMDFVIIGRDFAQELVDHVERITGKGRAQKTFPLPQFVQEMNQYVATMEQLWQGRIAKSVELQEMKDTSEALTEVINHLSVNNFQDPRLKMRVDNSTIFVDYLRKRFGGIQADSVEGAEQLARMDPKRYITLTTAHRSKGLEFDRVLIKAPENFPHPKAKTPDELDQEENAKYVAFTRAMKELHVLAPDPRKPKNGND